MSEPINASTDREVAALLNSTPPSPSKEPTDV